MATKLDRATDFSIVFKLRMRSGFKIMIIFGYL